MSSPTHESFALDLTAMLFSVKSRSLFQSALALSLIAAMPSLAAPPGRGPEGGRGSQREQRQVQRPMRDQAQPRSNPGQRMPNEGRRRSGQQEHLEQWMSRHGNLPLDQQQRALGNEPGFRQLPPQTQQHLRNRLTQLNNMPPEQRRRLIERNEAIERLSPPQRQQWRGAMHQLGILPDDRRRAVAQAFRELRSVPLSQQQSVLNSNRFRGQFSYQERRTLSDLLTIEPYLPAPGQGEGAPPNR